MSSVCIEQNADVRNIKRKTDSFPCEEEENKCHTTISSKARLLKEAYLNSYQTKEGQLITVNILLLLLLCIMGCCFYCSAKENVMMMVEVKLALLTLYLDVLILNETLSHCQPS